MGGCDVFLLGFADVWGGQLISAGAVSRVTQTFPVRACEVKHAHFVGVVVFGESGNDLAAALVDASAESHVGVGHLDQFLLVGDEIAHLPLLESQHDQRILLGRSAQKPHLPRTLDVVFHRYQVGGAHLVAVPILLVDVEVEVAVGQVQVFGLFFRQLGLLLKYSFFLVVQDALLHPFRFTDPLQRGQVHVVTGPKLLFGLSFPQDIDLCGIQIFEEAADLFAVGGSGRGHSRNGAEHLA